MKKKGGFLHPSDQLTESTGILVVTVFRKDGSVLTPQKSHDFLTENCRQTTVVKRDDFGVADWKETPTIWVLLNMMYFQRISVDSQRVMVMWELKFGPLFQTSKQWV